MRRVMPLVALLTACYETPAEVETGRWSWNYPYVGAPCALDAPGTSLQPERLDSIPERRGRETVDDRWAEIARQAPGGWGGRFSVDNRLTIYLVRPEEAELALPVLNRLGAQVGSRPDILRGRWDFSQMYDWRRYIAHNGLWSIEGVFSSDIDERANRISYGVTSDALPHVAQLLTDLVAPCGLVEAHVGQSGARPLDGS